MSGLYTVNITVMQSPNLSLIDSEKFFTFAYNVFPAVDKSIIKLISALILCSIVTLLLALFFKTVLGLCIRATGNGHYRRGSVRQALADGRSLRFVVLLSTGFSQRLPSSGTSSRQTH